jgi:hypothetical protein
MQEERTREVIPFKTACAAARKLAPGKVTLPCCTLHVEHPDGYDDVVMTVQFESSLQMDVDVRVRAEPFAFLVGTLPTDTISIDEDGPHGIACRNAAGAVCKVERFPAHKEIMSFDHTPPGRDVVKLDRTMLRAASIVGKLASRENTSRWSRQKVALVVRETTIIGAAGTNGYALKLVGDIDAMLRAAESDWEIMIPPPVVEAMMQLDAASWELHVDRQANDTCLATSNDAAFRWVYTPGAQWRLVVQRHTPERKQYAFHAGRILDGMKKVKNTHILFEFDPGQQRWSFLAIRTDKQIKDKSPRISLLTETLHPNGPAMDLAEREITLDTELVKELCSGVVEPVTIDVQNGYSAAVLTAERAAKDIPCGMYAVIMPIRPESRA